MTRHPSRTRTFTSRRLALEPLEPRAMCAIAAAHAVIPSSGIIGATLRPDGSVAIYGSDPLPFPSDVVLELGGDSPNGPPTDDDHTIQQWVVGNDGRLVSKTTLDTPGVGDQRTIYNVSPDGKWFVGLKRANTEGEAGFMAVWRRGSDELIPIGTTPDQTSSPMVRGVSNDGDVIYSAYVGEDFRSFAWDRTAGLLPLKSTYAHQGDTSSDAAKFTLQAISADGRTIVGSSGGGFTVKQQPTVWRDGVPSALPAFVSNGEITDCSATSVSDDGRVIGGYFHVNTPQLSGSHAAVWVDGDLATLGGSSNYAADGPVQIINGIGGDPTQWLAIGQYGIAASDGTAERLHDYVKNRYGLSLQVDSQQVRVMADSNAIYLVRYEMPSGVCSGFNCYTSGHYAAHLLTLPLNYERPASSTAYDLSNDGHVSALDVLIIINALNDGSGLSFIDRPELRRVTPKIDADGDGDLSASDALVLINFLNQPSSANAISDIVAAEGEADSASLADATDEYFFDLAQPRRKAVY